MRPRDPAKDEAILLATQHELATAGYSHMSLDDIAARAGVTKPTIYRRWPSKADLATAAVAALAAAEATPSTGSTHDDLVAHLDQFGRSLLRPNGLALLGTVLAEEHHTPELIEHFRERLLRPRRRALRAVLQAGRRRGEIRSDADIEAVVNALVGSFYARYLTGQGVPRHWASRVVDLVWPAIENGDGSTTTTPTDATGRTSERTTERTTR